MNAFFVVFKVVVSLIFITAGCAKLAKVPFFVKQFTEFRLPVGIMYLIGSLELIAVVGLWIEPLMFWAYSGLAWVMMGALSQHARARHPFSQIMPPAVMFLLCLVGAFLFW